jgi:hypothetical protein
MPIMVNTSLTTAPPKIRCRRIAQADADNVVALLTRGFAPRRTRRFWEHVIARLARRAGPASPSAEAPSAEAPGYGYLLENDGAVVGAILQIFSTAAAVDQKPITRCNVSSWYVEPAFRSYAPLLVSQALKRKDVTYLNISSIPHTRPILEAQGYVRYSNGVFATLPCLSRAGTPARIIAADTQPRAPFEAHERELLRDHAAEGCMSLWCETPEGAVPFVFRKRRVKRLVSCAQLIYCRDIADFVRFARPLGQYLAWRRHPLVILDANGPVHGLIGRYFDETMPRYFKGPTPPRLGDLSYTETAFFGV